MAITDEADRIAPRPTISSNPTGIRRNMIVLVVRREVVATPLE
jgi:hypothetical protein